MSRRRPSAKDSHAAGERATGDVSVVIPCYNGAAFLRQTLDSVLAQSRPPREVLVVDDGSTDDSAAIAASFGPPVRVISQENQGESVARNRGLDEAAGAWVAFLDADDLWEPEKLERQLAAAGPEHVAVHCNLRVFGAQAEETRLQDVPDLYELAAVAVRNDFRMSSTLMVRRAAAPRFATWTRYGEDTLYLMDLLSVGPFALAEEPLARIRKHGGNQSASPTANVGWHEARLGWLERRPDLDPAVAAAIRAGWYRRLRKTADDLLWARQWDALAEVRRHMTRFRGESAEVDAYLRRPLLPRWAYRLRDVIKGRRTPAAGEAGR